MASDVEKIRQLLKGLNDAWMAGRPEEMGEYLHENVVMVHPGFRGRETGRRACVDSYKEFIGVATIQVVNLSEPEIEIWGDTAVASYPFEIAYRMNGQDCRDLGRDLFILTRVGGNWRAVWRTLIPLESQGEIQ